jgi:iron complex outermembrane receptor protein
LNVNAAYFHYDMDDRQGFVLFLIPPGILEVGLDSIPEAEIDGVEMDLTWQPVDGLNINLGLAYLDAEVTKTISDVRGFPLAVPIPEGETLSLSPEWSYNFLASYTTNVTNDYLLSAQVDYTYRDKISGVLSDPNAITSTRSNFGARLTVGPANEKWAVSLWGRNLTNENDVVRSMTDFYGGRAIVRQLPRTYGIDLNYFF